MIIDNEGIDCSTVDRCACCGGPGVTLHDQLRDHLFGAPGMWSIRRCSAPSCGLGWLEPQPLTGEIGKLYQSYYTHGAPEPTSRSEFRPATPDISPYVTTGAGRRVRRMLRRMLPFWRFRFDTDLLHVGDRTPGRALEVGCGEGSYMRLLQAAGWETVGIDFDEKAVAEANRLGSDARVADLAGAALPDASFDAITMGNVIEHLPEPAAVFAECHRILKPGGRVVMITPNIDSYLHKVFGPDWRGLETPRHLYLFTARTLARFARAAGFSHVEAFSRKDPAGAAFIVEQSRLIAERSGRTSPPADGSAVDRRASLLRWLGVSRGEWVVLVAEK